MVGMMDEIGLNVSDVGGGFHFVAMVSVAVGYLVSARVVLIGRDTVFLTIEGHVIDAILYGELSYIITGGSLEDPDVLVIAIVTPNI